MCSVPTCTHSDGCHGSAELRQNCSTAFWNSTLYSKKGQQWFRSPVGSFLPPPHCPLYLHSHLRHLCDHATDANPARKVVALTEALCGFTCGQQEEVEETPDCICWSWIFPNSAFEHIPFLLSLDFIYREKKYFDQVLCLTRLSLCILHRGKITTHLS